MTNWLVYLLVGALSASGAVQATKKKQAKQAGSSVKTFAILTRLENGGVFGIYKDKLSAEPLSVGKGLVIGEKIWVEKGARAHLLDTQGNQITIAGPAVAEGTGAAALKIYRGSFRLRCQDGSVFRFEHAVADADVKGEAMIWASETQAQLLTLEGESLLWHPRLASAKVRLFPGFFSESSVAFKHLQPLSPAQASRETLEGLMARFDGNLSKNFEFQPQSRVPASAPSRLMIDRGSRRADDVIEPRSSDAMSQLRAHITGHGMDEDEAAPLSAEKRMDRRIAWSKPKKPAFEVGKPGQKLTEEQKDLIRQMLGGRLPRHEDRP